MVKIDPKLQAQVWQRVQGEQGVLSEQRLALMEEETAALLQGLMPHFPGNQQVLRQMLQESRQNLACLQGIFYLRNSSRFHKAGVKQPSKDRVAGIRRCYVNCLNLANAYERGQSDPEYGAVYGELAQAKRRQSVMLLALLGG